MVRYTWNVYTHALAIYMSIVNCGCPQVRNDTISSSHGKNPLIEGTTVNFTCSQGLDLIGPNASTCMESGHWEPDPREVNCKGS